jgi:hypothetical protein
MVKLFFKHKAYRNIARQGTKPSSSTTQHRTRKYNGEGPHCVILYISIKIYMYMVGIKSFIKYLTNLACPLSGLV